MNTASRFRMNDAGCELDIMRRDKITIGSPKDSATHQFKNLKDVTSYSAGSLTKNRSLKGIDLSSV